MLFWSAGLTYCEMGGVFTEFRSISFSNHADSPCALCMLVCSSGSGVAMGAECHPWERKKCQKSGKRGEKSGKKRKNREEKAKIRKVLSLCPSWQDGVGYTTVFRADILIDGCFLSQICQFSTYAPCALCLLFCSPGRTYWDLGVAFTKFRSFSFSKHGNSSHMFLVLFVIIFISYRAS